MPAVAAVPMLLFGVVVLFPGVAEEMEAVEDEDTDEEADSVDCEGEGEDADELLSLVVVAVVVALVVSTLLLVDDVLLAAGNAVSFGCILFHEREEF